MRSKRKREMQEPKEKRTEKGKWGKGKKDRGGKGTGIFHMCLAPERTWTVELFRRPFESPAGFDYSSYGFPGEGHSQRIKESANMGSQFVDAFIRGGRFRCTTWAPSESQDW